VRKGNKIQKEYLILWKGFPVDDASWVIKEQFIQPQLLDKFIEDDKPEEEKL